MRDSSRRLLRAWPCCWTNIPTKIQRLKRLSNCRKTQNRASYYLKKIDGPDRHRFTPYVVRGLQLTAAVNHEVSVMAESGTFKGTILRFALPVQRHTFMSYSGDYVLRLALDEPRDNLLVMDVKISAMAWHSGSVKFQEGDTTVEGDLQT